MLAQISGVPASGKTTGARFLDPKHTVYIDVDEKGLSWKGWRKDYNETNKNYFKTSDITQIYKTIKWAHDNPQITSVCVDTINTYMSNEEIEILRNASRTAREEWKDLAVDVYELYRLVRQLPRRDFVVFFMAHTEAYEIAGVTHRKTMTNGKKMSKLNLNSFLVYNLYTKIEIDLDGKKKYLLETANDGTYEARAPMDVFEDIIENNLETVRLIIVENEQ